MTDDIVEVHALFKGHVQGVGFRFSTKKIADSLGLKGTARNTHEGDVEIFVQGDPLLIEELFLRLKTKVGKVETIHQQQIQSKKRYSDFQIIF